MPKAVFVPRPCIECKQPKSQFAGKRCHDCAKLHANRLSYAYAYKWRAANPERFKQRQANWRANDRSRLPGYRAKRLFGVSSEFTDGEWGLLLWLFGHRCAYCMEPADSLQVEHVIPLSQGGPNTIENILPSCQSCNSSKSDKREWRLRKTGEILRISTHNGFPFVEVA